MQEDRPAEVQRVLDGQFKIGIDLAVKKIEVVQAEPVIVRKCNVESVVLSTTLRIIKEHPQSELARGLVMQKFGEAPPREADTYEKVKDWIETTFDGIALAPLPPPPSPTRPQPPTLEIDFTETRDELGTCNYILGVSRNVSVDLTLDDIREIVEDEAPSNLDDLISHILSRVEDDKDNGTDNVDEGDWEDGDDYQYRDHDATDSDNNDCRLNTRRSDIAAWLRNFVPDDILARLGN